MSKKLLLPVVECGGTNVVGFANLREWSVLNEMQFQDVSFIFCSVSWFSFSHVVGCWNCAQRLNFSNTPFVRFHLKQNNFSMA